MRNLLLMLTGCLLASSGQAAFGMSGETSEYVFIVEHSTITQTGGIAGVHRTYSITGRFQLQVDPEAGTASFLRVDANAVDDSDDRYTLDPNEAFNLTDLAGTVVDETSIRFEGKTDDGSSVLIALTFADGTVALNGGTTPPPNSADFFIFVLDAVAQRKYAGGTGTTDNPYEIATAADLITLGETPEDYDKHFLLIADIDLDPNLPGRQVFDRAVIAPPFAMDVARRLNGAPFSGVFDGNGHTISHLTIVGTTSLGLFGQLGWNFRGQSSGEPTCKVTNLAVTDVNIVGSVSSAGALAAYIEWAVVSHARSTGKVSGKGTVGGLVGYNTYSVTNCHSACTVTGDSDVGGLVGNNNGSVTNCGSTGTVNGGSVVGGLVGRHRGSIVQSYSTGAVSGKDAVGGLVGRNGICSPLHRVLQPGDIDRSYSTAAVKGERSVGGLIGDDRYGSIRQCYSTGAVSGNAQVGGLLSGPAPALDVAAVFDVTASFWDIETSGLTVSEGGIGKTTAEMQTAATFLEAGWDFVGEVANGTEDIWWILEGRDYPRLWWELPADDFEDGEAGPLWFVYEMTAEWAWLEEVNGRLEAYTTGQMEDVDALYVSNGWRLDATKAFAVRVDFHFSKVGVGDGRVTLGLVPTIELPVTQWAQFEVGAFDAEPFYLYEVRDGVWVEEKVADRFADDGTLYVSYDPATDELHLSDTDYGKDNALWTVAGLVQGRWQSESVHIILGGGSEDGMALTAGDAWLDNFTIAAGAVVQ